MKLINKLLRKEEIKRGDGKIYLNRWTIFRSKKHGLFSKIGLGDLRLYIHKFTESDHTKCLHDHPNRFISFIFWGCYCEEYWDPKVKKHKNKLYMAPRLRMCAAFHTHRVSLIEKIPCWSLVFMFPKNREWGFFTTNSGKRKWYDWRTYEDKFGGSGGCD